MRDLMSEYADRIAESRALLTRLWNLENDERPSFMIGDVGPALSPVLGVIGIPSAFGCELIWWESALPSAKPLIDDPMQVYDLSEPQITNGELGRIP